MTEKLWKGSNIYFKQMENDLIKLINPWELCVWDTQGRRSTRRPIPDSPTSSVTDSSLQSPHGKQEFAALSGSNSHFWTREPVQGGLSICLWGALIIAFSIISSRTTYWLVNAYRLCMQQWSLELANRSGKSPLLGAPSVPGPLLETFGCTSTCHMPQHAGWSSHPGNKRWGI